MAATVSGRLGLSAAPAARGRRQVCLGTELGGGCGKGQTEPHIDSFLIPHLPRSLQEAILAQAQRIVKGEVSVALKEQQAARHL